MTPPSSQNVLLINRRIRIPREEFEWTFARSGGPGGQNVNKVSSKAQLRWNVVESPSLPDDVRARFLRKYHRRITTEGEFLLTSQRYRDQQKNIDDCLDKLREMILAVAAPPKVRRPTKPTRAAREKRLREKRERARRKQRRQPPSAEE